MAGIDGGAEDSPAGAALAAGVSGGAMHTAAGGNTSSENSSTSSAGAPAPLREHPSAGDSCDKQDARHCLAEHAPDYLRCDGTRWVSASCGDAYQAYCESGSEPLSGVCYYQTELACAGAAPGARVCVDLHVHVCDGERSQRIEDCTGATPFCEAGACVCPDTCPAGCTSLKTDPQNCGRCGNVCHDAVCEAGNCVLRPFANAASRVQDVIVSQSQVYWANGGTIGRISVDGGDKTEIVSRGSTVQGLAVDDSYVFWTEFESGLVMRADLDGGHIVTLFSNGHEPGAIATDGESVYFLDESRSGVSDVPCVLMKVAKSGGAPQMLLTTTQATPSLAIVGGYVYLGGNFTLPVPGRPEPVVGFRLVRVPTAGGDIMPLGFANARAFVVDGTHVYFLNATTLTVDRMPVAGGTVSNLEPKATDFSSTIAVDAQHVYYVDAAQALVRRPLAGGTPEAVYAAAKGLDNLQLSGPSIFFSLGPDIYKLK